MEGEMVLVALVGLFGGFVFLRFVYAMVESS